MNLQETIRRILRESVFNDSLQDVEPNKYVYHTSNPFYRDMISKEGLVPKGKSESWLSDTKIDGKVIFAVNSNKKKYVWDSTYDDDIYRIDTTKINNKWYNDPNFEDGIHIITFDKIPLSAIKMVYKGTSDDMLNESIKRVLKELYSPEGRRVKPKKIVIHKSEKKNRKSIEQNGLVPKTGFCYKNYVGGNTLGKVKCRPAVFATNSTDTKQWFAKRWDGDVWGIDTSLIPDVVWYEDTHWFPDGQNKHIVTFDKIPPHALTLIQKGTE